ncbi:MAG: PIG-L deacetylase family protein [Polyangia bacterium]
MVLRGAFVMTRRRRALALAAAVVALALAGGVAWLRSRFREPGARRVASLVDTLGARSIVAVFAHPDDEIKVCGLLADAGARADVAARLITAARGDGGITSDEFPRATLARVREAEVRRHGAMLGVREQEVWSYDDAHLADVPAAELTARVVERLRAWQPDVVVTFEPSTGFTAHPDHMRIGAVTTDAFCAVGGDAHPPRWLVYIQAPRRIARLVGGERGRRVAALEPPPDFAVHVAPTLKVRAWQTHRSQRDYVWRHSHLPAWLLYRLYDDEHYVAYDRARACQPGGRQNSAVGRSLAGSPGQP